MHLRKIDFEDPVTFWCCGTSVLTLAFFCLGVRVRFWG